MKVRLTDEVINKLKHPNNKGVREGLRRPLGIASKSSTLWVTLKCNEWNGDLIKHNVLQYLEENLNMTREELLETVDE